MVGRIKISRQADAVRHLFMDLEKNAKSIKTCWFCGSNLPTMRLANQGFLRGNHGTDCPFENLAVAGELCIKLRDSDDLSAKEAAETALIVNIKNFLEAMTAREDICPFPVCEYSSGHRLECPIHSFERDAGF